MPLDEPNGRNTKLDELIDAFESAYARDGQADIADFLPPADHPLFREARVELLRVELVWSGRKGPRRSLKDLAARFPDLVHDRPALQELAFEEYRLRKIAGENPSPFE